MSEPISHGEVARLYRQYGPMVLRRCRFLLRDEEKAMDALQDVFVELVRHRDRLRADFPSSLLYRIATHVCLNLLRAARRKGALQENEAFAGAPSHESGYERAEDRLLLDAVFEAEDSDTRALALMYHGDGMTLDELAQVFQLSISGVRKRLLKFQERASQRLRTPVPKELGHG